MQRGITSIIAGSAALSAIARVSRMYVPVALLAAGALVGTMTGTANAFSPLKNPAHPSRMSAAPVPVAIFGRDDRTPVPERYRKLARGIGLLYNSSARTLCTAFCVAPDVVASAAHCLFRTNDGTRQPLSEFWFELRGPDGEPEHQTRIKGASSSSGLQSIIAGTVNLRVRPPIDAANDWALVKTAEPICKGRALEWRRMSPRQLETAGDEGRAFQIAYHRDYEHWRLAYSRPCAMRREFPELSSKQIRQEFTNAENLVLHQCDTAGASSGSPLLVDTDDGPVAVAINVGTYVQSRNPVRTSQISQSTDARTIANTGVNIGVLAQHIEMMTAAAIAYDRQAVSLIQQGLKARNYYGGPIDGIYGLMTRQAILSFERDAGHVERGVPLASYVKELAVAPPMPDRKPDIARSAGRGSPAAGVQNVGDLIKRFGHWGRRWGLTTD
ncbi:MAG: hypothetical protein GC150_15350 [Rhizobiales bacterium]|nr:hypothetical protein [Hyphomicrobiales bacterium]